MRIIFLLAFAVMLNPVWSLWAKPSESKAIKTELVLNWVPEPEFGGFYAALYDGLFKKEGLEVEIKAGGAGTPTVQMVGAGKTDFAITSGSEVIIARDRGSKLVAVFSPYQISPFGIMVHRARGFKNLEDLFKAKGQLSIQKGHSFANFLEAKYGFKNVEVVPYSGGVAGFLRDPNFSQQGFIFSEPIVAKRQGADPDFFLLADAGWNPFMVVLTVREEFLKSHEDVVRRMVKASRAGWEAYIKNPEPTNEKMAKLNRAMDLQTFHEGARAQVKLLEDARTKKEGFGTMTANAWKTHAQQLLDLKVIKKGEAPENYFRNF